MHRSTAKHVAPDYSVFVECLMKDCFTLYPARITNVLGNSNNHCYTHICFVLVRERPLTNYGQQLRSTTMTSSGVQLQNTLEGSFITAATCCRRPVYDTRVQRQRSLLLEGEWREILDGCYDSVCQRRRYPCSSLWCKCFQLHGSLPSFGRVIVSKLYLHTCKRMVKLFERSIKYSVFVCRLTRFSLKH